MTLDTRDRATYLGASEVAAAIGVSPWLSPLALYLRKTGTTPAPDLSANEDVRRGYFLEAPIIDWYARTHAVSDAFRRGDVEYRHPAHPYLRAHLDAVDPDASTIVEAKAPRSHDPWTAIPEHYAVQGYVQMACSAYNYVHFSVSHGGNEPVVYPLERDDDIIAYILERVADFWARVQAHDPPEPRTVEEARARWPHAVPESALEATAAVHGACDRLRQIRGQIAALEEQEANQQAEIMRYLGERERLTGNGEMLCTWKTQTAMRLDGAALKAEHPDLYAQYTKESTSRVFRLAKG